MLIAIIRNSIIAKLGLVGLVVGIGFLGYSQIAKTPERADLQITEGRIESASRVTRKSRRTGTTSVHYELSMKPLQGEAFKLTVPSHQVGDMTVRAIIGKTVRAEYDGDNEVMHLAQGGTDIVRFTSSAERRRLGIAQYWVDGLAILAASIVALLIGAGLALRRMRKEATAQP